MLFRSDTLPDRQWLSHLARAAARPGLVGVEGRVTPGRPLGPCEAAPVNESGGVYLTCNAMYRRDALVHAGGFDERFPYAAFEDCDLAARLRSLGEIAWTPAAVVVHPPRPITVRSRRRRFHHLPWVMTVARRYGYLGWSRYRTRHPRGRVLWSALVALPAGHLLSALRAFPSWPLQSLCAGLWALAEPFLALWFAVPELLRFNLDSAALHVDSLELAASPARVALVVLNYRQPDLLVRDRKSTRLNSSHIQKSRMPSSA